MFVPTDHLSPDSFYNQRMGRWLRWTPVPIHMLYLIFVVALLMKLQYHKNISWRNVFLSIFLADGINISQKAYYIYKERYQQSSLLQTYRSAPLVRAISNLVDAIGAFAAKIGIFVYLHYRTELNAERSREISVTACLSPLFFAVSISVALKAYAGPPGVYAGAIMPSYTRYLAAFVHPLLVLIFRGIQPLLIALRIDNIISVKWSLVFIPLWILLFGGIGAAMILMTCSPYVHRAAPSTIRESAFALVSVYSTQILLVSACVIIFLTYCVQHLDYLYGYDDGKRLSTIQILTPLLVLFVILIIAHPIILITIVQYQISLALLAQVHSNIANVLATHLSRQEAILEPISEQIYLLRISTNLYRKIKETEPLLHEIKNGSLLSSEGDTLREYSKLVDNIYQNGMPLTVNESNHSSGSHDHATHDQFMANLTDDVEAGAGVDDTINLIRVCADAYMHRHDAIPHHFDTTFLNHRRMYSHDDRDREGEIELAVHSTPTRSFRPLRDSDESTHEIGHNSLNLAATQSHNSLEISREDSSRNLNQLSHPSSPCDESPLLNGENNGFPVVDDNRNCTLNDLPVGTPQTASQTTHTQETNAYSQSHYVESQDPNANTCVICMAESVDSVLLDCGHAILCWTCALVVARGHRSQCPICRVSIHELFHISNDTQSSNTISTRDGSIIKVSKEGFVVRRDGHPVTISTTIPGIIPGVYININSFNITANTNA